MKEYHLNVNGHDYVLTLKNLTSDRAEVEVDGETYAVDIRSIQQTGKPKRREVQRAAPRAAAPAPVAAPAAAGSANAVTAPIPGAVLEVFVKEGDAVKAGQDLLKMEAMKMENKITAPKDGTVAKIHVKAGDPVGQGQALIEIS